VIRPADVTQSCDASCPAPFTCSINSPSATIKSRKPAFIELDPYNLTIKDEAGIHQIETDLFFEGMSGFSSADGPVLYVLSSANTEGTSSIYQWDFSEGALVRLFDLGFEAYGLAHHGTDFYVAFYDSATTQHMVGKVGGAAVVMPAAAGSLTYISDPAGDYLLAALRSNFVDYYRIALAEGAPSGAPTPVTPFTASADTGRYSSLWPARILWEDGLERDVYYVTKDDFLTLPCDTAMIIDAVTGEILKSIRAPQSGIMLASPVTWPEGVTSSYVNWANPQGLVYIDGRLFMITRYFWNTGPVNPSCYAYAFKTFINGAEVGAEVGSAGSPVTVTEGSTLTFRYEVRNNGSSPINWTGLSTSASGNLAETCGLPRTIASGETAYCDINATADSAPDGKAVVAKASVGCLADWTAVAWYKTVAPATDTTLGASATASGYWRRSVEYGWSMQGSVSPNALTLVGDQTGSFRHTVEVNRSKLSEAYQYGVTGQVCVTNQGTRSTENLTIRYGIESRVDGETLHELPETVTTLMPQGQLAAGATLCVPYAVAFTPVPNATYRTIVRASITNHIDHSGTEFGPEATADFSLPQTPALTESNRNASLTTSISCPTGFRCTQDDTGPWVLDGSRTLSYTVWVQETSGTCSSTGEIGNQATLTMQTSGTPLRAAMKAGLATGQCSIGLCTRGLGYWKNHPESIEQLPFIPSVSGIAVTSVEVAEDLLWMRSYGNPSNGITKLYAHLLTTLLNVASGTDGSAVTETINAAQLFLGSHNWNDWNALSKTEKQQVLGWASLLENYNNGKTGPGACLEQPRKRKAL